MLHCMSLFLALLRHGAMSALNPLHSQADVTRSCDVSDVPDDLRSCSDAGTSRARFTRGDQTSQLPGHPSLTEGLIVKTKQGS
jgi:hypothetical protein